MERRVWKAWREGDPAAASAIGGERFRASGSGQRFRAIPFCASPRPATSARMIWPRFRLRFPCTVSISGTDGSMNSRDGRRPATLIKFSHGLGDAVQFTVVLMHLARAFSQWDVDVVSQRGKHTAFRGLCRRSYHDGEPRPGDGAYQLVRDVFWYENYNAYIVRPNSKITNCLSEEFPSPPTPLPNRARGELVGIPYDPALGRYEVRPEPDDFAATAAYLRSIKCVQGDDGKFNAVIIHYQGNTSQHKKNLSDDAVMLLCGQALDRGFVPVILDWDRRSGIPDNRTIFFTAVGAGDPWL